MFSGSLSGAALRCRSVKILTLGLALSLVVKVGAQPWQAVSTIEQTAEDFIRQQLSGQRQHPGANTSVEAQRVDARLRLKACADTLEAYLPPGGVLRDNGVVGVRCSGPVAWKLFVPVRIVRRAPVAHVRGQLPAGHRLQADDISWEQQIVSSTASVVIQGQSNPVGQVLRQSAHDGQALRLTMLRVAHVVRRGDAVTLAISGSSLGIRMRGEALADGAIGQRIRAKNRSSGRIVEGIVRDEGLIEIKVF